MQRTRLVKESKWYNQEKDSEVRQLEDKATLSQVVYTKPDASAFLDLLIQVWVGMDGCKKRRGSSRNLVPAAFFPHLSIKYSYFWQ